jgi:hypothetical protein
LLSLSRCHCFVLSIQKRVQISREERGKSRASIRMWKVVFAIKGAYHLLSMYLMDSLLGMGYLLLFSRKGLVEPEDQYASAKANVVFVHGSVHLVCRSISCTCLSITL